MQAYVIPVCRFDKLKDGTVVIKAVFGTAFFINDSGVFITARHVIEDCLQAAKEVGGFGGLCVKDKNGEGTGNLAFPIKQTEYAVAPYDVAIGKIHYQCKTLLALKDVSVGEGLDVATYGYPATVATVKPNYYDINLRFQKGYIQRVILPNDMVMNPRLEMDHPHSFEVSFLISNGLSGAPLYIYNDSQPKSTIIGICVGTHHSEYKDSIDEYGIAQDIRPLLSWAPSFLNSKTLIDI